MNLHISPLEPDVQARLLFLKSDELLFQWNDGHGLQSKLVAMQDAKIAFSHMDHDSDWLPKGVVRAGRNVRGPWVVYVAPPQIMNITTDKGESLNIPLPMSLFIGWGRRYYLFAMKGKTFDVDAPVFTAPYPNVYDNGRICWGSHKVPDAKPQNIERTWKLFFSTTFNDHISAKKTKTHKDNVLILLRKLSSKRIKVFPTNELVQKSHSAAYCVESLLRTSED